MPYTDPDRAAFLKALDLADFEVSDWDAEFLENNIDRSTFTDKQRAVIDGMIERYGNRLKF